MDKGCKVGPIEQTAHSAGPPSPAGKPPWWACTADPLAGTPVWSQPTVQLPETDSLEYFFHSASAALASNAPGDNMIR